MSRPSAVDRLTRVREVLDYARALHTLATHGRGNINDTKDIVAFLEEVEAMYVAVLKADGERWAA